MDKRIDLTVICPVFNEEAIIEENLNLIYKYLHEIISPNYSWEIIIVDDGSKDNTGFLVDKYAREHDNMHIIHHIANLNLGNALKSGFSHIRGEYTIVLDLDLSYDTYHIGLLLKTLINTKADIVIASPYMKGGKVTAVPFIRRIMSRWVNRFMRIAAQEKLHTYTGMVRGYKSEFLLSLNLKTKDYEINPEILYKAMILRARIIEIPAHLDWTRQNKIGAGRSSGMRILRTFFSGLMSGFIFRPYIFFLGIGFFFLLVALYIFGWIFYNTFRAYSLIHIDPVIFDDRFSNAVALIFQKSPHAFVVGGFTLIIALLFLGIGFLSLQNKRYFEETFHLGTSILKYVKSNEKN